MPLPPLVVTADGEACALYPLSPPSAPKPPLLILHANGFSGRCYAPLVRHLAPVFDVYGLDMPGQGASPPRRAGRAGGPGALAAYAAAAVAAADAIVAVHDTAAGAAAAAAAAASTTTTNPCCSTTTTNPCCSTPRRPVVFGHSGGGLAAVAAEQARPGTWAALYLWEPVVLGAGAPADGLAAVARRRRRRWDSPAAAAAALGGKPPFATFAPACLAAYVATCMKKEEEHFVTGAGQGAEEHCPGGTSTAVTLACTPEDEAAVFDSAKDLARAASDRLAEVACPVMVAAGGADGPDAPLAAGAPRTAAALPAGKLQVWGGLRHLGPLEAPTAVGRRVCATLVAATGRAGGWARVPARAQVVAGPEGRGEEGGGASRL